MQYRVLGRTGVTVSAHCLGTMMFGDWGNKDPDESVRIIHAALDAGINFVDTADVYSDGESEEIVGRALTGRRDDVVLATKLFNAMGEDPNRRGGSRRWIIRAVEDSLRRLGTDHIDLYQMHRPDPGTAIDETLSALDDLIRQGKIRYAGCSTYVGWQLEEAYWVARDRGLTPFATDQPPYSILVRHKENDTFPVTLRHGMGVLVWSPLAGGYLAGKYRKDAPMPEGSRGARSTTYGRMNPVRQRFDLTRPTNQRKLEAVEQLERVADKSGVPLVHLALAFTLAHPAVTSTIIGPRTMEQLDGLLAGADVTLDEDTLDAIDQIVPPGTTLEEADTGWTGPWMAPEARRR